MALFVSRTLAVNCRKDMERFAKAFMYLQPFIFKMMRIYSCLHHWFKTWNLTSEQRTECTIPFLGEKLR